MASVNDFREKACSSLESVALMCDTDEDDDEDILLELELVLLLKL